MWIKQRDQLKGLKRSLRPTKFYLTLAREKPMTSLEHLLLSQAGVLLEVELMVAIPLVGAIPLARVAFPILGAVMVTRVVLRIHLSCLKISLGEVLLISL